MLATPSVQLALGITPREARKHESLTSYMREQMAIVKAGGVSANASLLMKSARRVDLDKTPRIGNVERDLEATYAPMPPDPSPRCRCVCG